MSSNVLVLHIPLALERAQRVAQVLKRPVEEMLIETLDTALPRLDDVPPETLAEYPFRACLKSVA